MNPVFGRVESGIDVVAKLAQERGAARLAADLFGQLDSLVLEEK
jgi:hypothetical protein